MKNVIFLLVLCISSLPLTILGGIKKLNTAKIEQIATKLTEFHVPTYSQNDPKPDVSTLGNDKLLIAKVDLLNNVDGYYSVQTNNDVTKLVQAVEQTGSFNVSWYYVKQEDMIKN